MRSRKCLVCENKIWAKGYCKKHYSRIHKYGSLENVNEEKEIKKANSYQVASLKLELKRKQEMKDNMYNFERRLQLSKEITDLQMKVEEVERKQEIKNV